MRIDLSPYAGAALAGTSQAACNVVSVLMAYACLRGVKGQAPLAVDQNAVAATIKAAHPEYDPARGGSPPWTCEALNKMGLLGDWIDLGAVAVDGTSPSPYDNGLRYALGKGWPCAVSLFCGPDIFAGGTLTIPTVANYAHAIALLGFDDGVRQWIGQNGMGVANGPLRLPYGYFARQANNFLPGGAGVALISLYSSAPVVVQPPTPTPPPPPVPPAAAGVNVALAANGGVATANHAANGYGPEKANNGDEAGYGYWSGPVPGPHVLTITFNGTKTLTWAKAVSWYAPFTAWQIEVQSAGAWQIVAIGSGSQTTIKAQFPAVDATAIRITSTTTAGQTHVAELEAGA